MNIDINTISSRLKQLRESLAYSIQEVYELTGISSEHLINIEACKSIPSGDDILILASLYSCDFRSILDNQLPAPAEKTEILFRRFGNNFSTEDRRTIQEFLYQCHNEEWMQNSLNKERLKFRHSPTGKLHKEHGENSAIALRNLLQYKANQVNRNIYDDFRKIGIHIFRWKLTNPEISGLYIRDKIAGHCVLINYNEDTYRQRFSTAHEVAHAIFDSASEFTVTFENNSKKYSKNDLQEIRANAFASNYLMPKSILKQLKISDKDSIVYWSNQLNVSTPALAKALKDAKLIDEEQARIIRSTKISASEKTDPEAPNYLTKKQRQRRLDLLERGLSDYYVTLCFEAHDKALISTGRLSEILRVDILELDEICSIFGRTISHDI